MPEYEVYFELYGKKLKTTIQADSEQHAKFLIKDRIIFHKTNEVKPKGDKHFDGAIDMLNDILNGFKK